MKRTTITLPDELAALLDLERRQREVSTSEIVREALTSYLAASPGRAPSYHPELVRVARSGQRHTAREAEALLAREWQRDVPSRPKP